MGLGTAVPLNTRSAAVGCFMIVSTPHLYRLRCRSNGSSPLRTGKNPVRQNRAGRSPGHAEGRCRSALEPSCNYPKYLPRAAALCKSKTVFIPRAGGNPVQKQFMLLNDSLFQPSRAGSLRKLRSRAGPRARGGLAKLRFAGTCRVQIACDSRAGKIVRFQLTLKPSIFLFRRGARR